MKPVLPCPRPKAVGGLGSKSESDESRSRAEGEGSEQVPPPPSAYRRAYRRNPPFVDEGGEADRPTSKLAEFPSSRDAEFERQHTYTCSDCRTKTFCSDGSSSLPCVNQACRGRMVRASVPTGLLADTHEVLESPETCWDGPTGFLKEMARRGWEFRRTWPPGSEVPRSHVDRKLVEISAWLLETKEGTIGDASVPDLGSLTREEQKTLGWTLRSLSDDLIGSDR